MEARTRRAASHTDVTARLLKLSMRCPHHTTPPPAHITTTTPALWARGRWRGLPSGGNRSRRLATRPTVQSMQQPPTPAVLATSSSLITQLQAALATLHDPATSAGARSAADALLLFFAHSSEASSGCMQLLQLLQLPGSSSTGQQQQQQLQLLVLFAAQTLRAKVNAAGASLTLADKQQLQHALLQQLAQPALPVLLLRQLCLALASLSALLPAEQGRHWLSAAVGGLPQAHALQLLHALAEEGSSDMRHVLMPALTSSGKLAWATATRERIRGWCGEALPLLLGWLQQQQQGGDPAAVASLLACLCAFVTLGVLHSVTPQLAEQTAQAGLLFVQSPSEQVVAAAQALLIELPEYAPEQLLRALTPHMLAVASAAVAAAVASPPDLLHAAAWSAAFAAYASALPQQLLAAPGDADDADSEATVQAGDQLCQALLQVAALPQLHAGQLVCLPALHVWAAVLLGAEEVRPSRSALQRAAASRCAAAADAPADEGVVAAAAAGGHASCCASGRQQEPALVSTCQQLLLHTACNWLRWRQHSEGLAALQCQQVVGAVSDVFAAVCSVLGCRCFLASTLRVWRGHSALAQAPADWLVSDVEHLPAWPQQQLQQAVGDIVAAPQQLRLQLAALMAAAATGVDGASDTARSSGGGSSGGGNGGSSGAASTPHGQLPLSDEQGVADLLSAAAAAIQQGAGAASQLEGSVHFQQHCCQVVQVWATWLVAHFVATPGGASSLGSLVQLLLELTRLEAGIATSAAAAVRAVVAAAGDCGWRQLHLLAPLLLQAAHALPSKDVCEADLLSSLAVCLAAPGASAQQRQELRLAGAQQLVAPAVECLASLVQQLQQGQSWQAIAKPADTLACHHLVRVRAALEAVWRQQQQQQGNDAAVGQEDMSVDDDGGSGAAAMCGLGCQPMNGHAAPAAALAADPAVGPVLNKLLPLVHALVVQHGCRGRLLALWSKVCTKLLRIQPELLLKQQPAQQQFLGVAVAGMVRPGGCSASEPLALALDLCCEHPGSTLLLLDAGPALAQAFVQLWAQQEAAALRQPGAGDAQPDLAEGLLKVSQRLMQHCGILQPGAVQLAAIVDGALTAAAGCAGCCHKRVGASALTLLTALLAAGTRDGCPPGLLELVAARAPLVARGALSALLVPSPLPRLNKVSAVLLELATVAAARSAGPGGGQDSAELLHTWLAEAVQGFVPQQLTQADAASLAGACAGLLAFTGRSLVMARKLKKRLRDFAEQQCRGGGGTAAAQLT